MLAGNYKGTEFWYIKVILLDKWFNEVFLSVVIYYNMINYNFLSNLLYLFCKHFNNIYFLTHIYNGGTKTAADNRAIKNL